LHGASAWFRFEQCALYAIDLSAIESGAGLDMGDVKRVGASEWSRDASQYIAGDRTAGKLYIVVNKPAALKRKGANADKLICMSPVALDEPKPPACKRNAPGDEKHKLKKLNTRRSEPNEAKNSGQSSNVQSPTKTRVFMTPTGKPTASPSKHASSTVSKKLKEGKGERAFNFCEYNYGHVSIYKKPDNCGLNRRAEARKQEFFAGAPRGARICEHAHAQRGQDSSSARVRWHEQEQRAERQTHSSR